MVYTQVIELPEILGKPHPVLADIPLLTKATVYTQVIESLPVLELPHPNPPLAKGREQDFPVSPLYKGGLRGV
ncbi:hypothetical protein, partial [Nostoc sp. WHI]|uniref:hypothetical protein n=1 Tax=Nostoc sp. WHI TaxID=2650611 RepID=UPI001E4D5A49